MKRRKVKLPSSSAMMTPPCIFCGAPQIGLGVFVPYDPKRFGAPVPTKAGTTSAFLYGLCQTCYGSPNVQPRVEQLLRQRAVAPWN